jgi:hypothetical protein
MFKLTETKSSIRTIRSGDPKFMLAEGLVMTPRAGFEISEKCPKEYRSIIRDCIRYNWLLPVAHIKDNELFWEEFSK